MQRKSVRIERRSRNMNKRSQSFLKWLVGGKYPTPAMKIWRNCRRNIIFDCMELHFLGNITVGLYFVDILLVEEFLETPFASHATDPYVL